MPRPTVPGTILLLTLACRGAPRGEPRLAAATVAVPPAPLAARDSAPCFPGDRMPVLPLDTTREYTLRVFRPDSARRYAMREYRIPLCPRDSAPPPPGPAGGASGATDPLDPPR